MYHLYMMSYILYDCSGDGAYVQGLGSPVSVFR